MTEREYFEQFSGESNALAFQVGDYVSSLGVKLQITFILDATHVLCQQTELVSGIVWGGVYKISELTPETEGAL